MHKNHTFQRIIMILIFVLATYACSMDEAQSSNGGIGMKAEAVPEGIQLSFDKLSNDINRMFVLFSHNGEMEIVTGTHDIVTTYADLKGSALEDLKAKGSITCPFVRPGKNYYIYVSYEKEGAAYALGLNSNNLTARVVADNGTYFENEVELSLNESLTGITLSAEPEYPAEVKYAPEKYWYSVNVDLGAMGSLGYSCKNVSNPFNWNFEPAFSEELKEGNHLQSGEYPAYISAFSTLIYDSVAWNVEIAKTGVFTFSF